jgi:hypothetical protein
MSVTCPSGHISATTDYCDQCGARIEAPSAAAVVVAPAGVEVPQDSLPIATATAAVATPCPRCGEPRAGSDRYCENCRYDFAAPAPVPVWTAIVDADRAYFERVAPDDVEFPGATSPRTVTLDAAELRIGRGGASGGRDVDVDIVGAAADPAVSRMHAVLVRQQDGSYAIMDKGSANGTTLNGSARELVPDEPVPLTDGDRIHIGAWTTITVRRSDGGH